MESKKSRIVQLILLLFISKQEIFGVEVNDLKTGQSKSLGNNGGDNGRSSGNNGEISDELRALLDEMKSEPKEPIIYYPSAHVQTKSLWSQMYEQRPSNSRPSYLRSPTDVKPRNVENVNRKKLGDDVALTRRDLRERRLNSMRITKIFPEIHPKRPRIQNTIYPGLDTKQDPLNSEFKFGAGARPVPMAPLPLTLKYGENSTEKTPAPNLENGTKTVTKLGNLPGAPPPEFENLPPPNVQDVTQLRPELRQIGLGQTVEKFENTRETVQAETTTVTQETTQETTTQAQLTSITIAPTVPPMNTGTKSSEGGIKGFFTWPPPWWPFSRGTESPRPAESEPEIPALAPTPSVITSPETTTTPAPMRVVFLPVNMGGIDNIKSPGPIRPPSVAIISEQAEARIPSPRYPPLNVNQIVIPVEFEPVNSPEREYGRSKKLPANSNLSLQVPVTSNLKPQLPPILKLLQNTTPVSLDAETLPTTVSPPSPQMRFPLISVPYPMVNGGPLGRIIHFPEEIPPRFRYLQLNLANQVDSKIQGHQGQGAEHFGAVPTPQIPPSQQPGQGPVPGEVPPMMSLQELHAKPNQEPRGVTKAGRDGNFKTLSNGAIVLPNGIVVPPGFKCPYGK